MNTNKPKLEEFMIFEDKSGEMGVILNSCHEDFTWWKCYKNIHDIGQVFNEDDEYYADIVKIYKLKYGYNCKFHALKFMENGNLENYNCIYEYKAENKEVKSNKPVNITINLTINNPKNTEEIANEIKKVLEKSNSINS